MLAMSNRPVGASTPTSTIIIMKGIVHLKTPFVLPVLRIPVSFSFSLFSSTGVVHKKKKKW